MHANAACNGSASRQLCQRTREHCLCSVHSGRLHLFYVGLKRSIVHRAENPFTSYAPAGNEPGTFGVPSKCSMARWWSHQVHEFWQPNIWLDIQHSRNTVPVLHSNESSFNYRNISSVTFHVTMVILQNFPIVFSHFFILLILTALAAGCQNFWVN